MSFSANVSALVASSDDPLLAAAKDWDRIDLKSVATILNGYPWRSDAFNDRAGMPVIRIRDVTSGKTKTLYNGHIVSGYWIENGDLVVGMDGDFNCRMWNGGRALLNQRVCKIAPNERRILKSFLFYVLPGYLKAINGATHSITVKHLSSKTIGDIPLPYPPVFKQRRIVAKLDSLTGRTGRVREELGRIPRLIQKYREAILSAAFSGDLTSEWRKLMGRRLAGQYPLGTVVPDIRYGTAQKCTTTPKGTAVLLIPNVSAGKIQLDDLKYASFDPRELAKLRLQHGDILVVRSNGSADLVGRPALVEDAAIGLAYAGYLIRLRPDLTKVDPHFLVAMLQSPQIRKVIETGARSTSGVHNINSAELTALVIPRPELDEQHDIVRRIETAFAWLDRISSEHANASRLLPKLDQAILIKAFRGELVTPLKSHV